MIIMKKKQIIFSCKITNYRIEFIIDEEEKYAIVNTIITDYVNLKAFLALMRNSIDNLIKYEIKKIRQTVFLNEWDEFLKGKTTWTIINKDTNINSLDLECDVNDFLYNYGIGIGIN